MARSEEESERLLADLQKLLNGMTDGQLARIGVTLERQDDAWLWLKDAIVEALNADGRTRAARGLNEHSLETGSYSIGISAPLLRRLAPIIRHKVLLDAEDTPDNG